MEDSTSSTSLIEKLSSALKNDNDLIKECQYIASDIENGKIKLLSFVEELGPFLTDKNVTSRAQGTLVLSTTLKNLSTNFLNQTELNFLTTFYCDRMKDNFEVIPSVLQGILAIIKMNRLPQDSPSRLLGMMFQHVHCQSQLQPNRKLIYLIFQTLLSNRIEDLRAMGPDLIYGVISSIDGERDPRNLMLLFKFLPNFIKQFNLAHLTEEMFEVIACYFPVDFNSSGAEAQSVTREDLAHSLAPCLYASPEFAEYCIPLLIERLDSSLRLAKLDSLDLLYQSSSTFESKGLKPHLDELWPVLRKEVYPGGDLELRNSGLKTITEIVKVLSKDMDDKTGEYFIDKIITDAKSSLCDVQLSLFWPALKLLEAVAKAGTNPCKQVLKTFVPLCLGQYSTKTSYSDRVNLTKSLNNFIAISEELGFTIKSVPELAWTDIPVLYLNALNTDNIELKVITFSGLTILKSSLNETARNILYKNICDSLDTGNNDLKNICHSSLLTFAKIYPKEIMDIVMKRLAIDDSDIDTQIFTYRLQALCSIAKIPELGEVILPKVVSVGRCENLEKSIAALSCLRKLVASRSSDSFNIQNFLYKNCNIIDFLISTNDSIQKLTLLAAICRSIVRKLDSKDQQIVVNKYAMKLSENLNENNVVLLEGILTPLKRNICLENIVNLSKNLLKISIESDNSNSKNISNRLIAVLINKLNEDDCLLNILNILSERIKSILENPQSDIKLKESSVLLNTSLTKALIVRGSRNSQDYLDFHINLLKDIQIGKKLANGFKTLSDRFEDTLTEDNYCNVKLFYKQRVFQNIIQKNFEFEAPEARENYLIALTHLVEEVPMELLLMHLIQLVPLLMESIALDNSDLILSSLVTLRVLLDTKNIVFTEQAQHFIPKFLSLTTHKEMKVRAAALECLLCYANYPTVLILPFKIDVLEQLADAIDDRKRLVRSVAVKTRTRWYLVGSPGEPKET